MIAHALRAAGGLSVGLNLLHSLSRLSSNDEYLITIPADVGYETICSQFANARVLAYANTGGRVARWWFDTFALGGAIRAFRPDRILALGNRGLLRPNAPQAILIHDPHLVYPKRHFGIEPLKNHLLYLYQRQYLRRTLKRTNLVLCQTATIDRRLRGVYGYRGRTARCPNAVSRALLKPATSAAAPPMPAKLAGSDGRFRLLCLTRFYAHKNLEIFLDLFERHSHELEGVTVVLTVSPDQHPMAGRFLDAVARRGLSDRIVNVGPIPQIELPAYYAHCHALILPTLLESFSGTYLEAMYYRRPILTSDLDFAREICDDAALYFDPWQAASIAEAIGRLRSDTGLYDRLVATGKKRLESDFPDWDQIAGDVSREIESI